MNTIYCGGREQGLREHWNLGGECGNGSFSNINQHASMDEIATPYDSAIFRYNDRLNSTYIGYGKNAGYYNANQSRQDKLNASMSKTAGLKRAMSKSNGAVYNNAQWDLVDAKEKDGDAVFDKVSKDDLPDTLKAISREELKSIVVAKGKERSMIKKEMSELSVKRSAYIAAEKAKAGTRPGGAPTLETEVEKIIKEQARRFKMKID